MSPRPENSPPRPLRILVAEDDAQTAADLVRLLQLDGHEVRVAADGPQALAIALADPPDVLLLDIGLPGLDGWQLSSRLPLLPRGRRPLVVAVTGYGAEEDRRRSEAAGVDLHLTKPIDPDQLRHLLHRFHAVAVTD